MENERVAAPSTVVAALEHLTGPPRGMVTLLSRKDVILSLTPRRFIQVSEARPGEHHDDLVARLPRSENSYEIEAPEGAPVWINGVRVATQRLRHGDMIEFGESGP